MSPAGLYRFEKRFPERIFDVGIAEQHAVTFAAGLATEGITPMCTIYSSFLQRGYDQVVHDVALQNLPGKAPIRTLQDAFALSSATSLHIHSSQHICIHLALNIAMQAQL